MANVTSHPTTTRATAAATVILSFCFVVVSCIQSPKMLVDILLPTKP